jgi:hypothetical protein
MSCKTDFSLRRCAVLLWVVALSLLVAGCATGPLAKKLHLDDSSPEAALAYYQGLSRMTPAELARERAYLPAAPQTPGIQLRTAMLLGHPRAPQDLGKGMMLLDGLLKSTESAAQPFLPLARQLADNYQERMKLENQLEKQGQQLKESQRKNTELQEKLDSLANIEKSLMPRPAAIRPLGGKR